MAERFDEAELTALTQQLVRFPSPQTALMEAEPAVQAFIESCVEPILAERGLRGRRDRMGNLIIEIGPQDAERSLLLMTYAMNHPASAMNNPYAGEIVELTGGRAVRGRGVSEQKGALAAAIVAVDCAHRAGNLRGRLVFALSSAGETGRHDAAAAILDELGYAPKFGIVALGTNNCVTLANKGRVDIDIVVSGKAAHSSTPWSGINAIDGARAVLDYLAVLPVGRDAHPHLGRATLTSTHIESRPLATHTIQNEVRLTFDRRLLPGQDPERAFAQVEQAVESIGGPWSISIHRGAYMYPCEISMDGPLFQTIAAARGRVGLPPPPTLYSHGALDAGFLLTRGCESAMWGPGRMEQFHADEECLLVSELAAGAEDYLSLIEGYLGS
ncbi:MAG: Acetylornithine deacetylase/Succinyl-diaminopimelate desuccinylase [Xanthobacteraceae bacterium]|jgi:acetylornithine deacetylase|nr:Acetylornithine deacetylase/Succinyl-diaminopimelate desuccinylase [Xanthobacteraceae bacterium]